ncbi:MAG: protoheme IX farnesyltransferase [Thermotogae bacterium]|nr:protoheme IX farnesyltransferase [Thermotogota bacterium]
MLVLTGVVGYLTADHFEIRIFLLLLLSMFLVISGATLINMWYDADIDAIMERTRNRPIPSGVVPRGEVFGVGVIVSLLGIVLSFLLNPLYGAMALVGFGFNVLIYTLITKRRTPWSIIWGGIAGAIPILGGRILAIGRVDAIGLLMALTVFLWVPIHNITFEIKYREDYRKAGVPVLPNVYGVRFSSYLVPVFIFLSYISMLVTAHLLNASSFGIVLTTTAFLVFFGISLLNTAKPNDRRSFILFKAASSYMFLSMVAMLLS